MEHVIVERVFSEPIDLDQVEAALERAQGCYQSHRIRHLRTYLSSDGLRTVCEYEAPDAEALRAASRRLGAAYERIWTARVWAAKAP